MFFRKVTPGTMSRLKIVSHEETYGRHILEKVLKQLKKEKLKIERCVDIGCGEGIDLTIVKRYIPNAELFGIDFRLQNKEKLESLGIKFMEINIEYEKLPFEEESIDFIILNQVLEHTKEIFWINHEIFRCLKIGGILFLGVPNLLSLHNRVLMFLGFHPTTAKSISAHVRVFSKRDVFEFYKIIGNSFCKIEQFHGSQFYPFPRTIARVLSKVFPTLAVSNFYIIRKTNKYKSEFLEWLKNAKLETNYFTGYDLGGP